MKLLFCILIRTVAGIKVCLRGDSLNYAKNSLEKPPPPNVYTRALWAGRARGCVSKHTWQRRRRRHQIINASPPGGGRRDTSRNAYCVSSGRGDVW